MSWMNSCMARSSQYSVSLAVLPRAASWWNSLQTVGGSRAQLHAAPQQGQAALVITSAVTPTLCALAWCAHTCIPAHAGCR